MKIVFNITGGSGVVSREKGGGDAGTLKPQKKKIIKKYVFKNVWYFFIL